MKPARTPTRHERGHVDPSVLPSFRPRFHIRVQVLFVVRFVAILSVSMWLINTEWCSQHVRWPLCEILAETTAFSLRCVGMTCHSVGNTISISGFAVNIVKDCDGLLLYSLYIAAVVALPVAHRARALASALPGLAILVFLNWLRLPTVAIVGAYRKELFDFVHTYFWQWGLICALAGVWLHWAKNRVVPLSRAVQ